MLRVDDPSFRGNFAVPLPRRTGAIAPAASAVLLVILAALLLIVVFFF